jgi:hypothetical protein
MLVLPLAANAFYCNNKLVSTDDHMTRVLALCGEPTGISRYVVYQTVGYGQGSIPVAPRDHKTHRARQGVVVVPAWQQTVALDVEEWFFNFGPNRFTQRLVFVNGYLKRVDAEGYGF